MPELREVFEMATKQIEPDVHEWERQQQRQRRRTRNRRLGTYALVAALVIGAAVIAVRVLPDRTEEPVPMTPPERPESGVALVDLDGTIVGMIGTDGTPEMRTLMIASSSYGLTLSPDANRAVVSDGTEIFTMNVDGTDLTKVTDGVNPAWSPDGSSIAFADSEGIHVIAPEGAGRRQIVSARVPLAAWPVWSPDGRRITYMIEGQTSSEHGIYVVDAEGGEPTRLTRKWDAFPSWNPDGTTIAFTRIGESQDLYSVAADGSARARPLITGPGGQGAGMWSPSGDLLAYWAFDGLFANDADELDIRVLEVRTGEDRIVVEEAWLIGWAPTGRLSSVSDPGTPNGPAASRLPGLRSCGRAVEAARRPGPPLLRLYPRRSTFTP